MTRTQGRVDGVALHTTNPADRIALRGVRLLARLSGMSQRTTIEQTFVNLEDRAIEAVYTFPLPESAAVCGFEVVTADRVLTGRVEEAEQAIEQYDRAVEDGDGAFMMEQDRPDVFNVRVGNLKPRQAATIRLTYVCPLESSDRAIRVAFPTTIAPRYSTATTTDPIEAMLDGDALNPPHVLSVPYGLTLRVEIDLGRELTQVSSPSHVIAVARDGDGPTVVSMSAGMTEMDRDIVLRLDLKKEHEPRVEVAAGRAGESYLAVTFLPEFDDESGPENAPAAAETVFVLDCSGSMMGDSIAQAKAALELCLRSLSPGDTFNVCRFGSRFELLASEPLPYSQGTLDAALDYVRASRDLGGTELYHPLEAILTIPPRAGTIRQIVLLTDGQVTNEPAVIELARQHRRTNRIFSFGIGTACSAFLVRGVARATGGAAEFIAPGERIDDKVLRTFSRLNSPMVSDVTIEWDGCEVQTLAELPPVFDGDVLAVFGRAPGRLPKQVTLSCTTAAGPKSWTLPLPRRDPAQDGGLIATMWARRMIQSLEEVNGLRTLRTRNARPTREQELLTNLSKEFGLLCSVTTFIAVEHRSLAERNEGRPELRRVPVQLARGWADIAYAPAGPAATGRGIRYRAGKPSASLLAGSAAKSKTRSGQSSDVATGMALDKCFPMSPVHESLAPAAFLSEPESVGSPPPPGCPGRHPAGRELPPARRDARAGSLRREMFELLALQMADGGFKHGQAIDELLKQIGSEWSAVRARIQPLLPNVGRQPNFDAERLARTATVRFLLRRHFPSRAALWDRADKKAAHYLADELGTTVASIDALQSQIASAILPPAE